jgi:beta-N-acetylhexosaminidase
MVILFATNYESPEQLTRLCTQIHALRDPPLLIAVDHEGGRVQRFRQGFTVLPPMRRLGQLWDRDVLLACRVAASTGYVLGAELRAHGVDLSFAPVLDVEHGRSGVIGDRAFHSDPRVVTMLASHLMHGLLMAGMANCGKHFPGHGWASADSHVDIPRDGRTLAAILQSDAAPYRWLGPMLAGVMPAHVVYSRVDPLPAGFARRWVEDILRRDLGFTGAVFSDDLLMEGAREAGSVADRAAAAFGRLRLRAGLQSASAMDEVLERAEWTPGPSSTRGRAARAARPARRCSSCARRAVPARAERDGAASTNLGALDVAAVVGADADLLAVLTKANRTEIPVSTRAGLNEVVAVAFLMPGSVSTTSSTTVVGNWMPIARPLWKLISTSMLGSR